MKDDFKSGRRLMSISAHTRVDGSCILCPRGSRLTINAAYDAARCAYCASCVDYIIPAWPSNFMVSFGDRDSSLLSSVVTIKQYIVVDGVLDSE